MTSDFYSTLPVAARVPGLPATSDGTSAEAALALVEGHLRRAGGHSVRSAQHNVKTKLANRSITLSAPARHLRNRPTTKRGRKRAREDSSDAVAPPAAALLAEQWDQYAAELAGAPPPTSDPKGAVQRLCKHGVGMDLHGARATVAIARQRTLVRRTGTIVRVTANTWQLLPPAKGGRRQRVTIVPKGGTVLDLQLPWGQPAAWVSVDEHGNVAPGRTSLSSVVTVDKRHRQGRDKATQAT